MNNKGNNKTILQSIPTYEIKRYLKANCVMEEHINIKDNNKNYFTFINITFPNGMGTKETVHIPGARNVEEAYLKAQKYIDIAMAKIKEKHDKPNILGADGGRI